MSVMVDLVCSKCEGEFQDHWSNEVGSGCPVCKVGVLERLWTLTPSISPGIHPQDACVVYQSLKEGGKIQYPGNNSDPIPARLRARGYEKVVMGPRELKVFERQHGVKNERMHYNRNGRGLED